VPTLSGVSFLRRHRFLLQVGAVLAVGLPVSHYAKEHPSEEQVVRHMADVYALGQEPHLSKAEIRAMKQQAAVPAPPEWVTEGTYDGTRFHRLAAPGAVALRVDYSDGFFTVSDRRHLMTPDDTFAAAAKRHSVAGGPPAAVTVMACCEGNDARVTVVLRAAAPTRVAAGWTQVSDLDLDLPAGHLTLANEGVVSAVVDVPPGRYRARIAGTGAVELEQDRERFRIELWPRRANARLVVLRSSSRR
jgi:hypothetical protein